MQRALPVVLVSVVLSAAASLLVVTLTKPVAAPPAVVEPAAAARPAEVVRVEELRAIRSALDELTLKVAALQQERASARREATAPVGIDGERGPDARAALSGLEPLSAGGDVFRAQVAEVLTEIEEEKEAERWNEELEERREEAVKAYEEYETFDARLEERLVVVQRELNLGATQANGLRSLLAVQNERNREMTRLWSEGQTSEEELGRIFEENRAAHRGEVMALLGSDQLGAYRNYVSEGGLGGRFSFFVAPWEEWGVDEGR